MAQITDPVEIRRILDAAMLKQPGLTIVATKHSIHEHPAGEILEGYTPFACYTGEDGVRKYQFGFCGEHHRTIALPDVEYIQTL